MNTTSFLLYFQLDTLVQRSCRGSPWHHKLSIQNKPGVSPPPISCCSATRYSARVPQQYPKTSSALKTNISLSYPVNTTSHVQRLSTTAIIFPPGGGDTTTFNKTTLHPHIRLVPLDSTFLEPYTVFNSTFSHPVPSSNSQDPAFHIRRT